MLGYKVSEASGRDNNSNHNWEGSKSEALFALERFAGIPMSSLTSPLESGEKCRCRTRPVRALEAGFG